MGRLNYRLPPGTVIDATLAAKAAQQTFEMVQGELSDEEYVTACEELADAFQARADAKREEMREDES